MKRRLTATSLIMALLLGLLAAPAAAQESPPSPDETVAEGITALECSFATALYFQEEIPEDEATATLAALLPEPDEDGFINVEDLDADGQQALVDAAFAALADMGQTFANVCSIYTPIVAGIVIDDDEEPVDEVAVADEEPAAVEAVTDEEPAVVAAEVLAVSGVNSSLLAIVGILLVGLGFLAVRRTRDESSS